MIILIDGDNNSGKTILLVEVAQEIKRPIWSNFHLWDDMEKQILHPFYEELTEDKIIFLEDDFDYEKYPKGLVMFIDEAYSYFESRMSNQSSSTYLSHKVNYQWRKRKLDSYLTFQDFSSVDKRFRDPLRWDIYILCEYREPDSQDDFIYHYYRNKKGRDKGKFLFYTRKVPYRYMTQFFNKYDTNEIVENPNIARLEYNMCMDNPKLMKNILNRYYDKLLPKMDKFFYNGVKFNHENVQLFLIANNIYPKFESKIYTMLKNKIRL